MKNFRRYLNETRQMNEGRNIDIVMVYDDGDARDRAMDIISNTSNTVSNYLTGGDNVDGEYGIAFSFPSKDEEEFYEDLDELDDEYNIRGYSIIDM